MDGSMQVGASSLDALSQQYLAITDNIANASTIAYKRRMTAFSQALAQQSGLVEGDGAGASPIQAKTGIDFSQGPLTSTGRPLDVALDGPGFLVVNTPEGVRYTRSGNLRLNAEGQVVTASGSLMEGDSGPITVPTTANQQALAIGRDGTISAGSQVLGKLKLVEVARLADLEPQGTGLYRLTTGGDPGQAKQTNVCQGFQESSNVNTMQELVGLVTVTRMYEANMKTIKTQDDRLKNILSVAGV